MGVLTRSNLTDKQLQSIEFLKSHPRCALWMPMGGGKSCTTLTAFLDLLECFEVRRMLVVGPLRVARDVWHDEVHTWAHLNHLTVSRIIGTRQQRLDALKVPADIHAINREQLAWLFSGFVEEYAPNRFRQVRHWPWDVLVLDESSSFKNAATARTKAAKRISTFGLADRIIELTGTPASNGYADLWSQIYILDHGQRLGVTEKAYLDRWFDPPPDWGFRWTLKPGAAEQIQSQLRDIVLSIEDDNPPVPVNQIKVTLSAKALSQYKRLERTCLLDLDPHRITAANAGVLGNKLLQLASGAIYTGEGKEYEVIHNEKTERLSELLDELVFTGPVIIGYNFIHELHRIGAALDKYCRAGQKWSVLKSEKELATFKTGSVDFGIIHPASGGHGLNALYQSGATNLVWFGPTPDLELFEQLNARIAGGHRRTGKRVGLHVLVARGTWDEHCMELLSGKWDSQTDLVRAFLRSRV